jgi:hypothetical protein
MSLQLMKEEISMIEEAFRNVAADSMAQGFIVEILFS